MKVDKGKFMDRRNNKLGGRGLPQIKRGGFSLQGAKVGGGGGGRFGSTGKTP